MNCGCGRENKEQRIREKPVLVQLTLMRFQRKVHEIIRIIIT